MQSLKVEITEDTGIVSSILYHPEIYEDIADDFSDDFSLVCMPNTLWILLKDGEQVMGCFLMEVRTNTYTEVHTCLLPEARGIKGVKLARMAMEYWFNITPCQKIITHVPIYNKKAVVFAKLLKLQEEGVNRKSFLKNGELIDQMVLGITKEDWLCQQ